MTKTFKSAFDLESHEDFSAIREDLFEIKSRVKKHFDQGLSPAETEAARGLLAACEVAEALAGELFEAAQ